MTDPRPVRGRAGAGGASGGATSWPAAPAAAAEEGRGREAARPSCSRPGVAPGPVPRHGAARAGAQDHRRGTPGEAHLRHQGQPRRSGQAWSPRPTGGPPGRGRRGGHGARRVGGRDRCRQEPAATDDGLRRVRDDPRAHRRDRRRGRPPALREDQVGRRAWRRGRDLLRLPRRPARRGDGVVRPPRRAAGREPRGAGQGTVPGHHRPRRAGGLRPPRRGLVRIHPGVPRAHRPVAGARGPVGARRLLPLVGLPGRRRGVLRRSRGIPHRTPREGCTS